MFRKAILATTSFKGFYEEFFHTGMDYYTNPVEQHEAYFYKGADNQRMHLRAVLLRNIEQLNHNMFSSVVLLSYIMTLRFLLNYNTFNLPLI